ncbi:aKG-HExxH-type peptide beta-hydroxylase [Sphaerisporangium fuscum]|uniref:aKG-HExxH-type peptide beta-hydroxylase n=1 Tax=Sphaerisporangium fuscum TaxID=2835868 RepID=UPI001BDD1FF9|nr:HEXXH motif-containing putative peptide modification protein [Sphaerisporangium fuscum]
MTPVSHIDLVLGSDPQFGSAEAIEARNLARFRLGLTALGHRNPGAAAALERLGGWSDDEIRPWMYDPVLRTAFEEDLASLEEGADATRLVSCLERLGDLVPDGTGPCERTMSPRVRPWPERGVGWVWTAASSTGAGLGHDVLTGRLEELFSRAISAEGITNGSRGVPGADMPARLRKGADLLAELLPHAGAGVLPHISLVGFLHEETVEGPVQSISGGDPFASSMFMAPERLADPWLTAESLLHEGLHLKLFDVIRTGSLADDLYQTVPIPWRVNSWTLTRVLFALHVYVHLVLFRAAAANASPEVRARYGEPPASEVLDAATPGSASAAAGTHVTGLERAAYLGRQAGEVYRAQLTPDGRRFVDWLLAALDSLTPGHHLAPPTRIPTESPGDIAAGSAAGEALPLVLNDLGYRKAEPVMVCPVPEQGRLAVVVPEPPRIRWLNDHAWLIYALCDGDDLPSMRKRYRELSGQDTDTPLATGLTGLLSTGLIVPN